MNRTLFYKDVYETSYAKDELDFLWSNLDKFELIYPVSYYRLNDGDIMRPDLVSYKVYGTVSLWWVLCYVNKCDSPLIQMKTGDLWSVPDMVDIYTFFKKYKVRES